MLRIIGRESTRFTAGLGVCVGLRGGAASLQVTPSLTGRTAKVKKLTMRSGFFLSRHALAAARLSMASLALGLSACGLDSTVTNITVASSVTKLGTDPTSVIAGGSFSDSIRVQVTDASSNPKSGVSVAFAVTAGGGSVTPATVITDANGKAAAVFITGTTVGINTATATVTGLTPVTFSITTIATPRPLVWSTVASGTVAQLHGVWGTSASDVWAVGYVGANGGVILHYNGTIWSSISSGTAQNLSGVWGTSASNVWAVGFNGTILHYNERDNPRPHERLGPLRI